jgi:hypothetical protein
MRTPQRRSEAAENKQNQHAIDFLAFASGRIFGGVFLPAFRRMRE